MEYEIEELVPIVATLAEKYTSKESSSITYEKAQQLMEAVLYCICEAGQTEQYSLIKAGEISAQKMYEIGVFCVEEKVKEALKLYNEMISEFSSYGNECLYDTVIKGLPEFFKWYDFHYEPQNTILTLDYPILKDISEYTGIDKIFEYILCIRLEQKFLSRFSEAFVIKILSKYDGQYRQMIDNICEIVLMDLIAHIMLEKPLSELCFESEEYRCMRELLLRENLHELEKKLQNDIEVIVQKYYDNDKELLEYLSEAVSNITVRLKNAAVNGTISLIFSIDNKKKA